MKLLISMFLVCAACGPAFTVATADEALSEDAGGEAPDAARADAPPSLDAGAAVEATVDAAAEAAPDSALSPDAAPVQDSAPPQDSAACVSAPAFSCGAGYTATPPSSFCYTANGYNLMNAAPSECATCETYNCACIKAWAATGFCIVQFCDDTSK